MNKILIVKNISHENPGLLEELLFQYRIPYTVVDLSKNQQLPDGSGYRVLIILGGPQSANDQSESMKALLQYVTDWIAEMKPCLGICLGMQVIVKAMGGAVTESKEKEIGFADRQGHPYEVELTKEGVSDPLFRGLPKRIPVFQLHGETVTIPSNMDLLAASGDCEHQVVKGPHGIYGLQGHFEVTEAMLKDWHAKDTDLRVIPLETLLKGFAVVRTSYTKNAECLFENYFKIAGLIPDRSRVASGKG